MTPLVFYLTLWACLVRDNPRLPYLGDVQVNTWRPQLRIEELEDRLNLSAGGFSAATRGAIPISSASLTLQRIPQLSTAPAKVRILPLTTSQQAKPLSLRVTPRESLAVAANYAPTLLPSTPTQASTVTPFVAPSDPVSETQSIPASPTTPTVTPPPPVTASVADSTPSIQSIPTTTIATASVSTPTTNPSSQPDATATVATTPTVTSTAVATTQQPSSKLILNGTDYTNTPTNLALNDGTAFQKVIVNSYWITKIVKYDANYHLTSLSNGDGSLQESGCRYLAHWAAAQGANYLVVDLEGSQLTLQNAETILGWLRSENVPNLKLSFYDVPHAVGPNVNTAYTYNTLDAENRQWAAFAQQLDFLTPSLYSPVAVDQAQNYQLWSDALNWTVAECRKIAPGKPVVPVLCPRYVDYANYPMNIRWTYIPYASWTNEVQATLKSADGVLVWDPANDPTTNLRLSWTAAANSWWPALQQQ